MLKKETEPLIFRRKRNMNNLARDRESMLFCPLLDSKTYVDRFYSDQLLLQHIGGVLVYRKEQNLKV